MDANAHMMASMQQMLQMQMEIMGKMQAQVEHAEQAPTAPKYFSMNSPRLQSANPESQGARPEATGLGASNDPTMPSWWLPTNPSAQKSMAPGVAEAASERTKTNLPDAATKPATTPSFCLLYTSDAADE